MAFDDQSFIQKLRQNQVFPAQGMGNPNPLIGMPNFEGARFNGYGNGNGGGGNGSGGGGGNELDKAFGGPVTRGINRIVNPNEIVPNKIIKPLDTAWIPGEQDRYAAAIATGGTTKDKEQAFNHSLALQKLDVSRDNLGLQNRKQVLAEKIASGKATDEEKNEYALQQITLRGQNTMNQIGARGDEQINLQGLKGTQATSLQNLKGEQASSRLDTKGNQRLGEIAQTALGKGDKPLSPNELRVNTNNNISKITLESPELAKYLIKDPNTGQYSISPEANETTRALITSKINGTPSGTKDKTLPSSTPTKPVTKPATKTNDPLGIR